MRRGIRILSSRRAATTASARVAMSSQAPPAGNDSAGNKAGTSSTSSTSTSSTSTSMPKNKTFYRRTLKPPSVAFSSSEGRKLFREALFEGTMESYFRLAEQFRTQDEPAFCGLSTLTMVLNALAVDPGRVWKGPWRWYHESMLDCCAPLEVVKSKGITLTTMCCLARCNGLVVTPFSPDTHAIEDLRAVVHHCSSEDRGKVVVVSYDRRGVNQTGTGHFSPIGGYHREQDLVLVMDTARFKHPPHWIPMETLWEAMKRIDNETGKPRGFMILEKAHNLSHRLFTAKSTNYMDWPEAAAWVNEIIEQANLALEEERKKENGGCDGRVIAPVADNGSSISSSSSSMRGLRDTTTLAEFVQALLALLPPVVTGLLTTFNSSGANHDHDKDHDHDHDGCTSDDQRKGGGGPDKPEEEVKIHDDTKYQDGVVLQALQGTEVYREITRMERGSRSISFASADGVVVAAAARDANGGGAKRPDACSVPVDTRAPTLQAVAPSPSPSPSSSLPCSSSAEEHGCGCSSRHVLTVLTYAFLLLLHKLDHESSCGEGAGGGGDAEGDMDGAGGGASGPLWRNDPLRLLPAPVVDEVKHVAGMLRGLVEMERCEKCSPS
eukprot:g7788.t1